MTSDVGSMIQQWTTGSAISHLRAFVAGVQVTPDQVQQYLVTTEAAPARAAARTARLAARSAAAPTVEERSDGAPAVRREEAAAAADSGEETFLTPRAGSPDSPALMEVDQQFEVRK